MAIPTIPNIFVNGNVIDAGMENANFAALLAAITDGMADLTVGSLNGIVTPVASPKAGQVLKYTGTGSTYIWDRPLGTVTAKSSSYLITDVDGFFVFSITTGSSTITMTLPLAANNTGRELFFKKVDTGTGTVVIDGAGSETIDGALTNTLFLNGNSVKIISDGSNWLILDEKKSTSWVSFTPTGSWVSNATYTGVFRRNGDSLEVMFKITCTGAPTSANLTITTPYTIDTAKLPGTLSTTEPPKLGNGNATDVGVQGYQGFDIIYASSTTLLVSALLANATYGEPANVTQAVPFTFGNTDVVTGSYSVPVVGW